MDSKDPCSLITAFIVRLQTTMYGQQRPRSACAFIAVWSGSPLSGFRLPCMDSEDPDKLMHPCSLIRAFIVRLQTPINRQQRPRSACASVQSDKGLHHPLTNPCIDSKSQDHLRNHAVWSGPSFSAYVLPCMDSKDPYQPAHPYSLIRAFIFCILRAHI